MNQIDADKRDYLSALSLPLEDKIKKAVLLLQHFEYLADNCSGKIPLLFSGGKDSVVIKELAVMSGIRFKPIYSMTTIDPPELVSYIRNNHPDVTWLKPKHGAFFKRLKIKGPPTRHIRWCCQEYKESKIDAVCRIIGVRAVESPNRKNNWSIFTRMKNRDIILCPILYWTNQDVWDFIALRKLSYCKLYDEGFKRIGCIGCPLTNSTQQLKEFTRWPKYANLWKKGVVEYWNSHHGKNATRGPRKGTPYFSDTVAKSGDEYFKWWLFGNKHSTDSAECIMGLF
jgi:phosphoadenosine phosphosulfate reductase